MLKEGKRLNINIGFDSCTAPLVFQAISRSKKHNLQSQFIEPCESGLFSLYANVDGAIFPCSFIEGTKNWGTGISLKSDTNFMNDVWNNDKLKNWRDRCSQQTPF